jgi:hypothetical protein
VREFVRHRMGPQHEPEHGAADATLFAELVQGVEAPARLDDMIAASWPTITMSSAWRPCSR